VIGANVMKTNGLGPPSGSGAFPQRDRCADSSDCLNLFHAIHNPGRRVKAPAIGGGFTGIAGWDQANYPFQKLSGALVEMADSLLVHTLLHFLMSRTS
jgi:hypothetical protein